MRIISVAEKLQQHIQQEKLVRQAGRYDLKLLGFNNKDSEIAIYKTFNVQK